MIDQDRINVGLAITDDANQTVVPLKVDAATNRIKVKIGSAPGASVPLIEYLKDPNRVPCSAAVTDNILKAVSVIKCDDNGYIKVKFI